MAPWSTPTVSPAQGIAEVVSQERVCVPHDISGFALVKTSLFNEGLLALNIGIIDPGWNGKISSFLTNFGKNDRLLTKGDVFLRLTFHPLNETSFLVQPVAKNDADYILEKRRSMTLRFAPSFLNISAHTDEAFRKHLNRILGYVSFAALVIAVIVFFLNAGNVGFQRWLQSGDVTGAELMFNGLDRQVQRLVEQNQTLIGRLTDLERVVDSLRVNPPGGQAPPNLPGPQPQTNE
jgi:hypothetical protein